MEEQRQQAIERRRRRLALLGGSVSLFLHVLLLVYLGLVYRGGGGGGGSAQAVTYELAVLNQEELTALEQTSFDELETAAIETAASLESAALTASTSSASELTAASATLPTLGGSGAGGGGDIGLGGGGGGTTSFFGIGSKGNRFAYIIDISGSMGDARKLDIARSELIRSIEALPDYAYFYVLLFNADFQQPPMQRGWMRARKPLIRQFVTWINSIDPGGGTAPRTSFMQVFSLDVRPDVIYFLTDGIFQDISAEEIAAMNRSGKQSVINTIQFGDRSGEDVLRNIARLTDGVYRFVPAVEVEF
jgi:hypothetical protein